MATPLKIPPPPKIANADPAFNRWLVELQGILNSSGGIDASNIPGFATLQTQVTTNTANIATLETEVGGATGAIGTLEAEVVVLTSAVATINGQITTLSARSQVFNGTVAPVALHSNGDWYADTANKHIYVQVAGAWVLII